MTGTATYSNELEAMFGRLPGWLQDPLREPFTFIDGLLLDVAGRPDELMQAADKYAALGARIVQLGQQQATDRQALYGQWTGEAYNAFSTLMPEVETRIQTLGNDVTKTRDVLAAAAQACTDGANAIVEIVWAFVSWLLTSLVANAILAVLSLGAALVAEIAAAMGRALVVLKDVVQVAERVSSVIEKVAQALEKLEKAVRTVQGALSAMLRGLDESGELSQDLKAANWLKVDNPVDVLAKYGSQMAKEEAERLGLNPDEIEAAEGGFTFLRSGGVKKTITWAHTNRGKVFPGPLLAAGGESALSAQNEAGQAEAAASP
jgi:WXG100 family type VII secretion target